MKTMSIFAIFAAMAVVLATSGCMTSDGSYYHGPFYAGLAKGSVPPSRLTNEGQNPFPGAAAYDALGKALDADLMNRPEVADKQREAVLRLEKLRTEATVEGGMGGYGGLGGWGMSQPYGATGRLQHGAVVNWRRPNDRIVSIDGQPYGRLCPYGGGPNYYKLLSLYPGRHHLVAVNSADAKDIIDTWFTVNAVGNDSLNGLPMDFKEDF